MRFIVSVLTLLCVLSLLVGCEKQQEVTLGGLFALSGYAAFAGEASRDGFLMAIEDSGMDVAYVIEDFHSEPKDVVSAATKLTTTDKAIAVLGPEWAEFSQVAAPISTASSTVFISPWLTAEDLDAPYFFAATPSERSQIQTLQAHMQSHEIKTIAVVYSANAWSHANVKIFKDELAKQSTLSIAGEFEATQDALDYRTELLKISSLNPDAIYAVLGSDAGQAQFDKQLRELNLNATVYVPFSRAISDVYLNASGANAEGILFPAPKERERMEQFSSKYEARFGKKPAAITAATTYDMTTLVLQAIKAGAKTSAEIKEYLVSVKDYNGYSNTITFNDKLQVAKEETEMQQIQDGKRVVVS